ncbi:hypothetical protein evm_013031 [Chilo suppressalis]|nr:hypothetical protein evm_013031 [Chilo suppressalis]
MLLVADDLYSVTGFGDGEILRGPQAENWRVPLELLVNGTRQKRKGCLASYCSTRSLFSLGGYYMECSLCST